MDRKRAGNSTRRRDINVTGTYEANNQINEKCRKWSHKETNTGFWQTLYDSLNDRPVFMGAIVIIGIYTAFMVLGYVQEQIYNLGDKTNGDTFVFSIFFVFVMCISNSFLSLLLLTFQRKGGISWVWKEIDSFSLKQLIITSLTYVAAMLATNFALTQINYPTQVLVKSAKMVPIVIGGLVVFRKTYPWYDYASVFIVTTSLIIFNLAKVNLHKEVHQTALGNFLLLLALVCDGLTGPRQDKLLSRNKNLTPLQMMFVTNFFASFWTLGASLLVERWEPWQFCTRHPESISLFFALVISGAIGQICVFQSLRSFGSLYTSLFTTLRKASSTVMSVYVFGHRLTVLQWGCIFAIFAAVMSQSFFSHRAKQKKHIS